MCAVASKRCAGHALSFWCPSAVDLLTVVVVRAVVVQSAVDMASARCRFADLWWTRAVAMVTSRFHCGGLALSLWWRRAVNVVAARSHFPKPA